MCFLINFLSLKLYSFNFNKTHISLWKFAFWTLWYRYLKILNLLINFHLYQLSSWTMEFNFKIKSSLEQSNLVRKQTGVDMTRFHRFNVLKPFQNETLLNFYYTSVTLFIMHLKQRFRFRENAIIIMHLIEVYF